MTEEANKKVINDLFHLGLTLTSAMTTWSSWKA